MKIPAKRPSFDHPIPETFHIDDSSTKANIRRPSITTQPLPRTNEIDMKSSLDTTFSGAAGTSFGKKSNSSFKDFKYHDSMKVTEDVDKSDTDLDDDVFQLEKKAYLEKQKRRVRESANGENEKRKVSSPTFDVIERKTNISAAPAGTSADKIA